MRHRAINQAHLSQQKKRGAVKRGEHGSKAQCSALVIYLCEDEAISGTTELVDLGEPILSFSLSLLPSHLYFPLSFLPVSCACGLLVY